MDKIYVIALIGQAVCGCRAIIGFTESNNESDISRYIEKEYDITLGSIKPNKFVYENDSHWEYTTNKENVYVHIDLVYNIKKEDINMERNREKINENGKINSYITVLEGYRDGEEIEYRPKTGNEPWRVTENPIFDFYTTEYRIKPKEAYRPYTSGNEAFVEIHERTPSGWLYNTITMLYEQILCVGDNGIYTRDNDYSYEQAFETFIYPNDEKFGVKLDNSNEEV